MKHIIFFNRLLLFILFSSFNIGFCQSREIINLALRDKTNFQMWEGFDEKLPKGFILIEKTKPWNTQVFILDSINLNDPKVKVQMDSGVYEKYNEMYKNTYYSPYYHTYLFRDSALSSKIDFAERLILKERALTQPGKKMKLVGKNYYTVSNYSEIKKGFVLIMSEPVFSSDGGYAFINLEIHLKRNREDTLNDNAYGDVTVVYEKQVNHTWKKILCNPHLTL